MTKKSTLIWAIVLAAIIICAFVAGYLVAPRAQTQAQEKQIYSIHGTVGGKQYSIPADGTYVTLYNLTVNGYTVSEVRVFDSTLITKLGGKFTPPSDPMAHPLNTIRPGGK